MFHPDRGLSSPSRSGTAPLDNTGSKNKMKKPTNIMWADKPDKQDYPAAENYLSLPYKKNEAAVLIKKLKGAAISEFAAKDILRAATLALV